MRFKFFLPAIFITLLGIVCNVIVSQLNAGMPAKLGYAVMNKKGYDLLNLPYPKHTLLSSETYLPFLADILPFGLSIGDVFIFCGLLLFAILIIKNLRQFRLN